MMDSYGYDDNEDLDESAAAAAAASMVSFDGLLDFHSHTVVPPSSVNVTGWTDGLTSSHDVANNTSKSGSEYRALVSLVNVLDIYLPPLIVAVGCVGNILSFLVFTATYLRRLSSSVYLAALALVDTVFLIVLLFTWLTLLEVEVINSPGWCHLYVYAIYVSSFLSVWFVVCFSFERYLSIQFPLKRHVLCRPRRAKIVVLTVTVVGLVLYNFAAWTSSIVTEDDGHLICTTDSKYVQAVLTINNVDTVITLVVPSAIIVFSNVRISVALSSFYRGRHILDHDSDAIPTPPSSSRGSSSSHSDPGQQSGCTGRPSRPPPRRSSLTSSFFLSRGSSVRRSLRRRTSGPFGSGGGGGGGETEQTMCANASYNRLQMKVTKMLLLVSIVFLLFNTPGHAIRAYMFVQTLLDKDYTPGTGLSIAQNLLQHLFYANFATNFALYNASGRTFRRAMVRLGRCFALRVRRCISGTGLQAPLQRGHLAGRAGVPVRPSPPKRTVVVVPGTATAITGRDGRLPAAAAVTPEQPPKKTNSTTAIALRRLHLLPQSSVAERNSQPVCLDGVQLDVREYVEKNADSGVMYAVHLL